MNQLLCLVWLFEEELDNGRHKLQLNLGVLVLSNSVGLVTASLLLFFTAIQWGYFNDFLATQANHCRNFESEKNGEWV